MKNNIKLNCNTCGKEFEKYIGEYNSQIKLGRTHFFCCLSCANSFYGKQRGQKIKEDYEKNPVLCKHCGNPILFQRKNDSIFCSHSCAAIFNNVKRTRKILAEKSEDKSYKILPKIDDTTKQTFYKIVRACNYCGKEFELNRKGRNNKKYCSLNCSSKWRKNQVFDDIENGNVNGHHSQTLRRYLIYKRGQKCEICGISEWQGKPLVVICDHIDGNALNNQLTNLRLLCSNCDANLPTYKSKNKGNGRHSRRQKYKDGKSF